MAVRFATVTEEEIRQINEEATPATQNPPVWLILTIPISAGALWL